MKTVRWWKDPSEPWTDEDCVRVKEDTQLEVDFAVYMDLKRYPIISFRTFIRHYLSKVGLMRSQWQVYLDNKQE